jgi:uncharacterized Zn-finger protein
MAAPSDSPVPAPPEVIVVNSHRLWCDGGGPLGHPRVYLEMGGKAFVECGYCDRRYVLGVDHGENEAAAPGQYEGPAGR